MPRVKLADGLSRAQQHSKLLHVFTLPSGLFPLLVFKWTAKYSVPGNTDDTEATDV